MATTLIDAFADEERVIDSLPTKEFDEVEYGDGIGIVYDSVHGKEPQVVKGVVIGGKGDDLFVLEPREDNDTTIGRRVFTLREHVVKRSGPRDFVREGADFGHRPFWDVWEDAERPDNRDHTWPVETKLGDVMGIVPMDVDPSYYRRSYGEFHLPRYGFGWDSRNTDYVSITQQLVDWLFD